MNKITRKIAKELGLDFGRIIDDSIEDSREDYRRGSNFFVQLIYQIDEKYFPEPQYRPSDGFWESNMYIRDTEYDTDFNELTELNRVEKKEVTKVITIWELVK